MSDRSLHHIGTMTPGSAALALGFSSIGHFFAHLLMLLYPTVVLVLEGRWGMSYGDLLSLSLGGFVLFGLGALPPEPNPYRPRSCHLPKVRTGWHRPAANAREKGWVASSAKERCPARTPQRRL